MNDIEIIQSKIFEIRGQRVMLDRDLAAMYGVETKKLNQAVKRNQKRFEGDDFMFRLTKDEATFAFSGSQIATLEMPVNKGSLNDTTGLRSQIVTSNKRGGNRYQIQAIRDEMEEILADQNDINEMTSAQLDAISTALAELQSDKKRLTAKPRRPIGFNV